MKPVAVSAIILVQLWVLAPVCCCWFEAAATPARRGGDSCCCSQSDDRTEDAGPVEKSSNCRCEENKVQLPPQIVLASDPASQRLALDQLAPLPAQLAPAVAAEPSGLRDFREWPPPRAISDRLASLHRLNL